MRPTSIVDRDASVGGFALALVGRLFLVTLERATLAAAPPSVRVDSRVLIRREDRAAPLFDREDLVAKRLIPKVAFGLLDGRSLLLGQRGLKDGPDKRRRYCRHRSPVGRKLPPFHPARTPRRYAPRQHEPGNDFKGRPLEQSAAVLAGSPCQRLPPRPRSRHPMARRCRPQHRRLLKYRHPCGFGFSTSASPAGGTGRRRDRPNWAGTCKCLRHRSKALQTACLAPNRWTNRPRGLIMKGLAMEA